MSRKKDKGKDKIEPFENELKRLFHRNEKATKETKEAEESTRLAAQVEEIKLNKKLLNFHNL